MNSTKENNSIIKEWFVRVGIIIVLVACLVSILVFNIKHAVPLPHDENISLGNLLWQSCISGDSGFVLALGIILDALCFIFAKQLHKGRVAFMTATIYLITVFDNIAIEYPLHPSWIAFANLVAIIICAVIMLAPRRTTLCMPSAPSSIGKSYRNTMLSRAISDTDNKNIIATQLYKVQTSLIPASDSQSSDRVQFDICHIGDDFVRNGYDVNSISRTSYVLDRNIVDCFPIILHLYEKLRNSGDDETKNLICRTIDEKVKQLESMLAGIEISKRAVTKDDCCVARALSILLSFRHKLNDAGETQDDYLGEISLHDGDLKLSIDIESKLFSLYRTGILGAALLDTQSRHVFQYRKPGSKTGRKYCVSQLVSSIDSEKDGFSRQTMYICLFTIKESNVAYIPGYMFKSIADREKAITTVLNTINQGGDNNG